MLQPVGDSYNYISLVDNPRQIIAVYQFAHARVH